MTIISFCRQFYRNFTVKAKKKHSETYWINPSFNNFVSFASILSKHGLRTPREKIPFTAQPKIHSHSQIFRYGRSIFCLPHRPNFSDIFDLCLHWVFVVRVSKYRYYKLQTIKMSTHLPTGKIVFKQSKFSRWLQYQHL